LKLKNLKLVKNKMNLTNDEKKIIRFVLKKHLEEVNETEKLLNMDVSFLAAEEKYEMFVEKLIKKLK
tara:strand:- start:6386 stop:6586 length:201 start_codon:yes stop_codon:yes gene_type:complete